jgi:membrane associated rhomboid family serine protease
MGREPHGEDPEIPAWMISAGKLFGLNAIQTRWKLVRWARWWRSARRDLEPASRRSDNQICASCGAVQDPDAKTCASCGERLSTPVARFMKAIGLSLPSFMPASSVLGLAMILIYFRMMMAEPGQGLLRWDIEVMLAYGALWGPAVEAGQWWRLGTAIFLHLGVVHIGFNVIALSQIGPMVEGIFGRGRMVFWFMATGLFAFGASVAINPMSPTAGASGALMGLVGMVGGWGQRAGTRDGRFLRDQMIKWGAYTMLFGLLVGANHVAHAAGFAAGAIVGYFPEPQKMEKRNRRGDGAGAALGALGGLAAALFVVLCLFPPAASRAFAAQIALELGR